MAPTEKKGGNEPQSYGSNEEWQTGKTGQTIGNRPQKTDAPRDDFYDSRIDEGSSVEPKGGYVSPEILADASDQMKGDSSATPIVEDDVKKMSHLSGEPRHSYFRDRDYKDE